MHSCANLIIDYFSGKMSGQESPSNVEPNGPLTNGTTEPDNLMDPAKLCYVIRQALRESAIAGVKMLILCDLFSKRKNELSRDERHEIIKYCKSRLPIFMNQLYRLLDVIKISFSNLSAIERMEIASYFVPEIEDTLDSMFKFVTETKSALEQIISISSSNNSDKNFSSFADRWKKGSVGEALGKSLKNALHMRELMKLRSFHERVTVSFLTLMHKKESFSEMNLVNKNRSVAKNLEQLIDEIPMFMLRIEELKSALDEKLTWKEWKYLFKLGTSKVAWVLSRLVCHRGTLQKMITYLCDIVNREQFTKSLVQLGLLDPPASSTASTSTGVQSQLQNKSSDSSSNSICSPTSPVTISQFCLVESLCHPPISTDSNLAKNAVLLLKSGLDTDMSFEIVTAQDSSENASNLAEASSGAESVPEEDVHCPIIKAHCVVIASRCDWFRKALLSGMKESIDKKIIIHDTSPNLFRIFLEYLYGSQVDTGQLSTEQLADLMQLSDRYEVDSLKQISEGALKTHIDEDSALFLLSIADQFNAKELRTSALEFIALNKDIIKSEVFYDLPEDLQSEVEDMITWVELRNNQRSEEISANQFPEPDSPSSMSSSLLDIEELTSAINMSGKEGDQESDSSSLEDLPLTHDSAQLEACVAQLRDIVGETVAHEELIRVSLAADYDINRALNFFFS
ncbi:uncharacterized protein LOC129234620 [Uloborus diversus]|uniref:uncharacterized protein LOC129234620 n=1 Tax=Uloborus diversus TaxID=327109 RepID=UPI00240941D2|nr:uncharacterized protein LOC129234620 [Uloborus diversus]